jgi:hypothetical protein
VDFGEQPNRTSVSLRVADMRTRLLLSALLIGAHTLLSGAVSLGEDKVEPPLSPQGETVVNDPETAAHCVAHAQDLGARLNETPDTAGYFNWTLGPALVTHNETWGIVCRIDFTMAGQDVSPRINRLVIYVAGFQKLSVMIVMGENIAPLEVAASSVVSQ